MSNIFLKKKNCKNSKNISNIFNKKDNVLSYNRELLPSQKEWFNSIYSYNKNNIKIIPPYDKIVSELIKSFFNIHFIRNKKKERFTRRVRRIRFKRLSINRILLGKIEILHTNKKAFFNIYIYNGEKRYLLNKLKKKNKIPKLYNRRISRNLWKIKKKASEFIYLTKILFKTLKQKSIKKKNIKNIKSILLSKFLIKNLVKKLLRKQRLSRYYKYLLWINKSKFENTYIYPLYKLISKFYDKKIEFNIINLKYLHLNSSILSQFLAMKIKNKKNKLRKVLKKYLTRLRIPSYTENVKLFFRDKKYWLSKLPEKDKILSIYFKYIYAFSWIFNLKKYEKHDLINLLLKIRKQLIDENSKQLIHENSNQWVKTIFDNIKHKAVLGIRLKLSGRLTRRYVAARSISILKYKGGLKNVYTSYKGFPSTMLRGHIRSNIQYTKISSKRRIGSFGLKGWINNI